MGWYTDEVENVQKKLITSYYDYKKPTICSSTHDSNIYNSSKAIEAHVGIGTI